MAGLFDDDPAPRSGGSLFGDVQAAPPEPPQTPSYRVLARKYRPVLFDDLIGQEGLVRTIRNAFAMNRIAHAFMFTGVRGVGKTTTARIIARALNCVGRDGNGGPTADPCGVCTNCITILQDRHPDVIEMDAASKTGVDDVRDVIEATRFQPMMARTKVFIIDEVHMLSRHAFNALLKTLEEPPPHIKFVFATTEVRRVPVTILSRCQRFDLKRVAVETLAAHFQRVALAEKITIEPDAVDAIARAADGSVRDGLSLLDQAIALGLDYGIITADTVSGMLGLADRSMIFDLMDAIAAGDIARSLRLLNSAHDNGAEPGQIMQDLLGLAHTLSRLKSIPDLVSSKSLPELERTRGKELADQLSIPWLGRLWQMLSKGILEIEQATDRRACADMILIRLCHVADLPPPAELVHKLSQSNNYSSPRPAPITSPGGRFRAAIGSSGSIGADSPATVLDAIPDPDIPAARRRIDRFEDVVALALERQDLRLYAHLRHDVRVVRFLPPVIELNLASTAPRDLAARISSLLEASTKRRWTIALSREQGAPSLAEAEERENARALDAAIGHPLVQAVLDTFPGSRIEAFHRPEPASEVPPSVTDTAGNDEFDSLTNED